MHILQVVRDMNPRQGGPPSVVAGTAAALHALGHRVTIAATVKPGEEAEVRAAWSASGAVTLELFAASSPHMLGGSAALTAYMRDNVHTFGVVHMHGVWDACLIAAARAARGAGRPYFVSPHGMLDRWSLARSYWKKWSVLKLAGGARYLNGADALFFGTEEEAIEAAPLGLVPPAYCVANGVSPALLGARDLSAKGRLNAALPETTAWSRTLLFYSRFHPKKGLDLLIKAFADVAADFPGVGLLAAGIPQDQAYTEALRTQIAASGAADRIVLTTHFAGPDSRFLLDAVDLFVLPSHQEGFSMAIVEAMARALPVLITDRCHFLEVGTSGAGRIVPPTVAGLTQGLRDLLALDPDALASAGAAGQALVTEHYTWPQVARQLLARYQAAVSAR